MPESSDRSATALQSRAVRVTFRDAALIGALVNAVVVVGLLFPGADPWDEQRTVASVAVALPMGLLWGAFVGAVLAAPVALVLGLSSGAASWRWTPVPVALMAAGVSVFLAAGALGGLILPFARVLEESLLPVVAGGVALVAVLLRGPRVIKRYRRGHKAFGQPDRNAPA